MRFRLRGASAPTSARSEVATASPAASKHALALCFAPLLLLGAASAGSAITRHVSPRKQSTLAPPVPVSALNQTPMGTRTCRAADAFLEHVLGDQTKVAGATVLADRSQRFTARSNAWSVLCDTSEGNYLLLINAKTRQVYAVNHVEETNFNTDYTRSDEKSGDEDTTMGEQDSLLSQDAARGQALRYLHLIGVAPQNLKMTPSPWDPSVGHRDPSTDHVYNFAFTNTQHPTQSFMVVVNGKNGHLQSLWCPIQAI